LYIIECFFILPNFSHCYRQLEEIVVERSAKAVFGNNVLGGKFLFLRKNYNFKL